MAEKKEKGGARNYIVLRAEKTGDEACWFEAADVEASSAEQAIRLVATDQGANRYVAIPERSWSEMNIQVITVAPKLTAEAVSRKPATKQPATPAPTPSATPAGAAA